MYVLGPNPNHPAPALKRLDHLICRVPDIVTYHRHFVDVLGFPEAWPVGRFWPEGRTSGVTLGGINLEFIQPDSGAPTEAITDTLVFEPTSLDAAEMGFQRLGVQTRRFDKNEPDPELLRLRGFAEAESRTPQLICRNLFIESEFPLPVFLCDYAPFLKDRLTGILSPHGKVISITMRLAKPGSIWRLGDVGYQGNIEIIQSELEFGEPRVTEVRLDSGSIDLQGIDPGFCFT